MELGGKNVALEDWAQSGHWGREFTSSLFQIKITMLVSVENLEEAGEYVSFQLQIRRYCAGRCGCLLSFLH